MTVPRAPMAVARAAVGLAVRPLPELDDRLRYRAEFTADLSVLPRLGQLGYAAGILTHAFVLRAALGAVPTLEEAVLAAPVRDRVPVVRCRVLGWHRWVTRETEDGGRYAECACCGRLAKSRRERSPSDTGVSYPLGF